MKTKIIALAAVIGLVGCGDPSAAKISYPVWPKELSDCEVFNVSDGISNIKVVRCPMSSTTATYKQGKTTAVTVVIDGVEYEKKGK
jgi:hypothetical protein